jgi:hypothetical protein
LDPKVFLLLDLALAFSNVGTMWAHEMDIFPSWKLLDPSNFHAVQRLHWPKQYRPHLVSPRQLAALGVAGAVLCQAVSIVLTAGYWGRWQARIGRDPAGPDSRYLAQILNMHWARFLLVCRSCFCGRSRFSRADFDQVAPLTPMVIASDSEAIWGR